MTTITTARPPAPRGPAARPAVAPVAPVAAVATRATPAADVLAWCDKVNPTVGSASAANLQGLLSRGKQLLATPGLDARTTARVRLVLSAAYGQLAKQGVNAISNGRAGFAELQAAFRLAPGLDWAATGYGRAIAAFNAMGWAKRNLFQVGVGVNAKAEAARILPALAAFPNDPYAQLTRLALATTAGDAGHQKAARAAIATMDPAGVARIKAELAHDAD